MIKFKDINYNRNSYFNESIEKFISRISFDNEEWKYYNNHILVSTKGRIIGLNIINKIYFIKGQYIKSNGYLCVNIDGIPKYVHRLVGEVFIPNPNNFPEINHLDEVKINKFESITKAAKFVNVSISSISAALTGKSKTCKNFIWKYDAIER